MTITTEELLGSLNQPLPFSDEAEKGIVSCLLQRPELINDCPAPAVIYHEATKLVYSAMLALAAAGSPFDPVTLTHAMRDQGTLANAGGAAAISELFAFVPLPSHFPYYRKIVMDKFTLRETIRAAALTAKHALQHGKEQDDCSVADVVEDATNRIMAVRETAQIEQSAELPSHPIRELVLQVLDEAESRATSGVKLNGISTGIARFDEIMGGLEAGCLTVISAESSDGKSAICRQILESVAQDGHQAVDYTYEMMPKTEARRVLCSQARIDASNLKSGMLTRGEQMALASNARKVSEWDFHVVDVAGKTIEQICRDISRRSRKLTQGKKIVAMIDYIQLCKTSAKSSNREREVAHITATAKQCAKMTGAHLLMPSQQNKDGDVRESMAIEQDADTLIQIQKIKPAKSPAWKKSDADEAEPSNVRRVFFKKVRDGERHSSAMMELVGRHYRFEPAREETP